MKKMTLDLETLTVKSFEVPPGDACPGPSAGGTTSPERP